MAAGHQLLKVTMLSVASEPHRCEGAEGIFGRFNQRECRAQIGPRGRGLATRSGIPFQRLSVTSGSTCSAIAVTVLCVSAVRPLTVWRGASVSSGGSP